MKKNVNRRVISRHGKDKSTMQNIIRSLVMHGAVSLSLARAKDIQRHVEKLVSLGTTDSVTTLRLLSGKIGSNITARKIIMYAQDASKKRKSGFTRILKVGERRGDATVVAKLMLVDFVKPVIKTLAKNKTEKPVSTVEKKK